MRKSIVALVEWYGPYSSEEAGPAAFEYADGLYMVTGRRAYQRKSEPQYIGLASSLGARLSAVHHKIPEVKHDIKIWLGQVVSPRTPGKKMQVTDVMLDLVEWAHAYFMQLPLNDKKTRKWPKRDIVVYNRWWRRCKEVGHGKRPNREWPDIIDFIDGDFDARLVWFGKNVVTKRPSEFKAERQKV